MQLCAGDPKLASYGKGMVIRMNKIFLWGAGWYADYVYDKVIKQNCDILGMIDSDAEKQGREWKHGLTIYAPEELSTSLFDYILVTTKEYKGICDKCIKMGIAQEKVLAYWRDKESQTVFENRSIYISHLEAECKRYEYRLENYPFEYGVEKTPIIKSKVELLNHILRTRTSLCRFGDGEFDLMLEKNRPWFQMVDKNLAERLRDIIKADIDEKIVVAIADDFGSLEQFNVESADAIRQFITRDKRKDIMQFLDLEREYYDAYVSRPYILYKDKSESEIVFELFKEVWTGRNVILVEGRYARIGIGNDLLSDAASVKRILCPQQNCWDKYEEIMNAVKNTAQPGDLVCVSLGPTATVLAYDLAKEGIQALDIGQIDNEYEWYLRGASQRIAIPGKMVAEIGDSMHEENVSSIEYQSQIIAEIG